MATLLALLTVPAPRFMMIDIRARMPRGHRIGNKVREAERAVTEELFSRPTGYGRKPDVGRPRRH